MATTPWTPTDAPSDVIQGPVGDVDEGARVSEDGILWSPRVDGVEWVLDDTGDLVETVEITFDDETTRVFPASTRLHSFWPADDDA